MYALIPRVRSASIWEAWARLRSLTNVKSRGLRYFRKTSSLTSSDARRRDWSPARSTRPSTTRHHCTRALFTSILASPEGLLHLREREIDVFLLHAAAVTLPPHPELRRLVEPERHGMH